MLRQVATLQFYEVLREAPKSHTGDRRDGILAINASCMCPFTTGYYLHDIMRVEDI